MRPVYRLGQPHRLLVSLHAIAGVALACWHTHHAYAFFAEHVLPWDPDTTFRYRCTLFALVMVPETLALVLWGLIPPWRTIVALDATAAGTQIQLIGGRTVVATEIQLSSTWWLRWILLGRPRRTIPTLVRARHQDRWRRFFLHAHA